MLLPLAFFLSCLICPSLAQDQLHPLPSAQLIFVVVWSLCSVEVQQAATGISRAATGIAETPGRVTCAQTMIAKRAVVLVLSEDGPVASET